MPGGSAVHNDKDSIEIKMELEEFIRSDMTIYYRTQEMMKPVVIAQKNADEVAFLISMTGDCFKQKQSEGLEVVYDELPPQNEG